MFEKQPHQRVTIATSIMPRRLDAQIAAVNSWLQLGFDVISVNIGDEVVHLHQAFPEVRFETVDSINNQPPYIPLSEIFTSLSKSTSKICGIVNSDIIFAAGDDLSEFISKRVAEGMVFGSRIDHQTSSKIQEEYSPGFDFFFFDKNILSDYPESDFCLGLPTWDYWFPLVALINGVALFRLVTPIALHQQHEPSWNELQLDKYWKMLCESSSLLLQAGSCSEAQQKVLGIINCDWREGASELRHCLHFETESYFYRDPDRIFETIAIHCDSFNHMKTTIRHLHNELCDTKNQLETIHNSSSWRLTEPLRKIKSILLNINK